MVVGAAHTDEHNIFLSMVGWVFHDSVPISWWYRRLVSRACLAYRKHYSLDRCVPFITVVVCEFLGVRAFHSMCKTFSESCRFKIDFCKCAAHDVYFFVHNYVVVPGLPQTRKISRSALTTLKDTKLSFISRVTDCVLGALLVTFSFPVFVTNHLVGLLTRN